MTDRTETDEILDGYLTADFDPLQAFVFDDDTDADDEAPSVLAEGPFNMPNPEAAPQFQRDLVAFDNGETAEERIDALFAQMPTFHKMLFTIMGTCASPLPTADLEEVIAEMKRPFPLKRRPKAKVRLRPTRRLLLLKTSKSLVSLSPPTWRTTPQLTRPPRLPRVPAKFSPARPTIFPSGPVPTAKRCPCKSR